MTRDFSASFDSPADRLEWSATKWEKYRGRDVIPLWIADMDYPVAPAIQRAVAAHVRHGNYGYMSAPRELAGDLVAYHAEHYGWQIEPEWIVWLSGLVLGINLAVKACCGDGESALTFSPVYPPFLSAAPTQGRRTLEVPLALDEAAWRAGDLRYHIDFARLDAALLPDTRLLLLCHPHNPVGSLFSRDELDALADFCVCHDLYVCSDEVHCDLILDGTTPHVPFARVLAARSPTHLARSITLHGPGKVFNLAGLGIAWAIIPDAGLRKRFRAAKQRLVPEACCFGYTALQAALRAGEPWRQALLARLRRNRDQVSAALDAMHLPHSHPAATYLTWIDTRRLVGKVGNAAQWFEQQGVGLSDGADFGAPGFVRLNFAAGSAVLDEALRRMQEAVYRLDAGG
ncbi:MalY/PatB family protein [Accumulibacter sp.]|uniref:MalY/PatB family protein n=1 Tax=Accumulibacter sp. TaxID=2053492 RepID=UPI002614EB58|nr:PatB family C-S lyase [Accumulibacter sp.]